MTFKTPKTKSIKVKKKKKKKGVEASARRPKRLGILTIKVKENVHREEKMFKKRI